MIVEIAIKLICAGAILFTVATLVGYILWRIGVIHDGKEIKLRHKPRRKK